MARYIIFSFTSFVFTKHTFLWKCFRFNRIFVDSRFYRIQHRIVHYIDNILFILPGRFRTSGSHPVFVFRYPYQFPVRSCHDTKPEKPFKPSAEEKPFNSAVQSVSGTIVAISDRCVPSASVWTVSFCTACTGEWS